MSSRRRAPSRRRCSPSAAGSPSQSHRLEPRPRRPHPIAPPRAPTVTRICRHAHVREGASQHRHVTCIKHAVRQAVGWQQQEVRRGACRCSGKHVWNFRFSEKWMWGVRRCWRGHGRHMEGRRTKIERVKLPASSSQSTYVALQLRSHLTHTRPAANAGARGAHLGQTR